MKNLTTQGQAASRPCERSARYDSTANKKHHPMKRGMKKLIFTLILTVPGLLSLGQTKIGNNPESINEGAILELESSSKGLLIPRVSLSAKNLWTLDGTPVNGMLIYNTSETPESGFYYWDSGWMRLINDVEQVTPEDDQQILVFRLSGSDLEFELEDGGGVKTVSFLDLIKDKPFTNHLIDSLAVNPLFTDQIQNIILNTNTHLTEEEVDIRSG